MLRQLAAHSSFVIWVFGPHCFMHSASSLGVSGSCFWESFNISLASFGVLPLLLRLRRVDPSQEQACSKDDDCNSEVERMAHVVDTRLVEGASGPSRRRYKEAPSVPHTGSEDQGVASS